MQVVVMVAVEAVAVSGGQNNVSREGNDGQ